MRCDIDFGGAGDWATGGGNDAAPGGEERRSDVVFALIRGVAEGGGVLDEDELRQMSPEQRAQLARALAELDLPSLFVDPRARLRRRLALGLIVFCCLFLAVWIGVLAVTLPSHYRAGGWRGAWVGFDIAELVALGAVGWTAWRGKQMLIVCLVVAATLLCCDAWFDLTLDWGTRGFAFSVVCAVFAELPLAAVMIMGARRLLRLSARMRMTLSGQSGPVPPLWRLALFGEDPPPPSGSPDYSAVAPRSSHPDLSASSTGPRVLPESSAR
jgi:hypothetical protein